MLLTEIPLYTALLTDEGHLVVSGFYEADAPDIVQKAVESGLAVRNTLVRNQWTSLVFDR